MSAEIRAQCPCCRWDNDGRLAAVDALDTYGVPREDAFRLFSDGYDADVTDEGQYVLCDVRECPECGYDADNVAEWVGIVLLREAIPRACPPMEAEAEGLDAIASEEAETIEPRARRTDPSTSRNAAASVRELTTKQRAVLSTFRVRGPMTDEQLVEVYGRMVKHSLYPEQSQSGLRTRRKELVRRGELADTGEKRRMQTGRMAIVWGPA